MATDDDRPISYDDKDEEVWDGEFGEDSPFGSGEDLAAALVSLGGGEPSSVVVGAGAGADDFGFEEVERSSSSSAGTSMIQAPRAAEKPERVLSRTEQLDRVLAEAAEGNTSGRSAPTTWSSRNSTKAMESTEELMEKLRNSAIDIALKAAADAVKQRPSRPRRPSDDLAA